MKTSIQNIITTALLVAFTINANAGIAPETVSDWDVEPKAIKKVSPEYPAELRHKQVEGDVDLSLVIDANGSVVSVRAVKSDDPDLTRLAVKAVREWHFMPAMSKGQPVAVRAKLPITFKLAE